MKDLKYLVPKGHAFVVDDKKPFLVDQKDLRLISRIGVLTYTLMRTVMEGMKKNSSRVSDVLFGGLDPDYQTLSMAHPERLPVLTRVDLMVDSNGKWKIAEIDPSNKHGLGISHAVRFESGAGERQKMLPLLVPYVTDNVTIILGQKDIFFRYELRYFAKKLAEYTGKKVFVVSEEDILRDELRDGGLILDFPNCRNQQCLQKLVQQFMERPTSFINPPRHHLGGKALMTLPYEHSDWLESNGMPKAEVEELRMYLPPTFLGPFVGKEVYSSGAKGVSFYGLENRSIFQQYIKQYPFDMDGQKFVRLACFFVGSTLAEVLVTATTSLPVHNGIGAINYHMNVNEKEENRV